MKDLIKNITWTGTKASDEEIEKYVSEYAKDMNVYITNLVINNGDVSFTTYSKISYSDLVVKLIREKYTIQDELAIQRKYKKGVNELEFDEYDAYVEDCKEKARQFIAERENVLSV